MAGCRQRAGQGQAGFTLVELMIVVGCIAILAALAVPSVRGYMLEARLQAAKPYLAEIAAKQRMHAIRTGRYCCSTYTSFNEQVLSNGLGLSLAEAGDFCFQFVCRSGTLCEATTGANFIAPTQAGGTTPEFEVWAILRATTGATVTGPSGAACTVATGKAAPTGWVRPATATTSAGRAGQAVVLRYAPPANGRDATNGAYRAIRFDWLDGVSMSDAVRP
ncbi:type IV pilin protein [Zavarzinia sp. CC-PAN008]|uniref:type IV pilin protein n=1 Tax=Zavarzinia sp. CC-PAN008 TaxID=3243332 RepID=UPI003F74A2F6